MIQRLCLPALAAFAVLAFGGAAAGQGPSSFPSTVPPSVIPAPWRATPGAGTFFLAPGAVLAPRRSDTAAADVAAYLRDLLVRTRGLSTAVRAGESGAVTLAIDPSAPEGDEAYALDVSPSGVRIRARSSAGLFYGAVTLWELATADGGRGGARIPSVSIEDRPRFAWRGVLLDSVRHFQSAAFVEKFIDVMALHKLNVLQWHLTDDQGWRLEIKAYPKLTSVGAWRTPAGADAMDAHGRPRREGGFYTQEDVRRVVAYAARRHVLVVPEIEMPGHATAALAAYPELASGPAPNAPSHDWGVFPNLFKPDDATFTFLERVLGEVMDLFPSPYIHLGGDEAVKDQWKASTVAQAQIKALGLKGEDALQGWFMGRMGRFLAAHGRRLVGWDEILQGGGLPEGAVVTSWHGTDGAIAAAKAGHDAILAPVYPFYLDNRQGGSPHEPPGRGMVFSLKAVYGFEPMPPGLSAAEQAHVLGLQMQLWAEHIRTEPNIEWMAFPRAAAGAELAWSTPQARDWTSFRSRMDAQRARYRALGVNAADTIFRAPDTPDPLRRASQELTLCSNKVSLNLEDDAPHAGPRGAFLVDILNPCWRWADVDLSKGRAITVKIGQVPFNFQVGADAAKVPLPPPATADGELEIRDGCGGDRLAVIPVGDAAKNPAVSTLRGRLPARAKPADLCFTFTRRSLDPFWVLDSVQLSPADL